MPIYHPQPNDKGQPVELHHPSKQTPLPSWTDAHAVATVTPAGPLPETLNGIPLGDWKDVPGSSDAWMRVEGQCEFGEPPFNVPTGIAPAAGVVVLEADGRIWLVAPSNAFGGYTATFPKGRVDQGTTLQACAIREAFEEAGLKVRITGWLADSKRSKTYTRYYLAERIGGNPAAMGWESQAVHLVPRSALADFLTNPNDLPLLQAIQVLPTDEPTLGKVVQNGGRNVERMRMAIGLFRAQFGHWPTGLALGSKTLEEIRSRLTPLGYAVLADKLTLCVQIKHYLILPYDADGNQFDYGTEEFAHERNPVALAEVDRWIWGIALNGD